MDVDGSLDDGATDQEIDVADPQVGYAFRVTNPADDVKWEECGPVVVEPGENFIGTVNMTSAAGETSAVLHGLQCLGDRTRGDGSRKACTCSSSTPTAPSGL